MTSCNTARPSFHKFPVRRLTFVAVLMGVWILAAVAPVSAQSKSDAPAGSAPTAESTAAAKAAGQKKSGDGPNAGTPASTSPAGGQTAQQGGGSKSANGSDAVPALEPAPPPAKPAGRPSIGLALAGGGALAMSEIGVLQWFEEHHIPVDMIAGTSMGSLVGALYATGHTVDQLKVVMTTDVFNSVFRISTDYKNRSFRRREDSRDLPNAIQIGLRHGVSFRNSVLTDQGLNGFLDREFYRYDDRSEFNALPIPFRCISTDLNDAKIVTFARGSIPDAVRASVSLPGVYRPFEMNGHEYVDGGVLENLPTQTIHDMHADVTLAVSIPLLPVGKGDLDSIFGVLQRSFAVAIEANERQSRTLADVLMIPDLQGFTSSDYLKTTDLAARGYAAAEQNKAALLKYALSDAQWTEYLATRASRVRGPAGKILRVRIKAPSDSATHAVQKLFDPLVNQPMNPPAVDALLAQIRSDGRYDADYTVTYEHPQRTAPAPGTSSSGQPASDNPAGLKADAPDDPDANRPTLLVTVAEKKTGPPFLEVGANVEAQSSTPSRATLEAILLDQDLGGFGSELRTHITVGTINSFNSEYYRLLPSVKLGDKPLGGLFAAPRVGFSREPFYIYANQVRLSQRQLQRGGGGFDLGWGNKTTQEFRAGWEINNIRWTTDVGSTSDGLSDVSGNMQHARLRYVYDTQDRALVPQFGTHIVADAGYLYNAVASPNAPVITLKASTSHEFDKNIAVLAMEGGTMFNRYVAQPFRFTLGGPLRLTASAIDEYRGTDYFLFEPAFLRRIASLPAPLGQSIYLGGAYEVGQMRAPDARTVTRQDVFFGIVAETPLGIITLAPAIGDDGHRKFVFTLGKLF